MCFQILALRLLQAVLPSWDKTERSQDMKFLVEKLFNFLGSLLITCSSDLPLLRGTAPSRAFSPPCVSTRLLLSVSFNCRFPCRGLPAKEEVPPQASLTATHSSTLAEEIVSVLRILHALGQWNSMINDYIDAQLSAIGDVMSGCQSEAVRIIQAPRIL